MANVFRSNRSQAVRIPKAAEFPPEVRDVDVIVEGERRVLVPKKSGKNWEEYFARRKPISKDFVINDDDLLPLDDISLDG